MPLSQTNANPVFANWKQRWQKLCDPQFWPDQDVANHRAKEDCAVAVLIPTVSYCEKHGRELNAAFSIECH